MTSIQPSRKPALSARGLLLALALLFAATPFLQGGRAGMVIEAALLTFVLLAALLVAGGRRTFRVGLGLAVVTLTARWLNLFDPHLFAAGFFLVPGAAFFGLVVFQILRHILTANDVNIDTLCACLCGFLLLGLLWSMVYALLAAVDPRAFAFSDPTQTLDSFNAVYFSFVTLSTIGYGDITPVSRAARMFAVMEAISGMFYVAVLVARLVSIHSANATPKND